MIARSYSSEGFVLYRKNYGEADRVLIVLAKNYGKVKLLAKSVRKPKSRKRGHIEIFSKIKFSASKTRGIDIVTEAELLNSFDKVRKSLKKVSVAYFLCEVINYLIREDEKNAEIYDLFEKTLLNLEESSELKKLRADFIREIVTTLGFWPEGKELADPDSFLREVAERGINSARVGKALQV